MDNPTIHTAHTFEEMNLVVIDSLGKYIEDLESGITQQRKTKLENDLISVNLKANKLLKKKPLNWPAINELLKQFLFLKYKLQYHFY